MPFDRPTLAALITQARSDLRSRLSIAGPLLRRAMADVLGIVWGGLAHMMHGHLQWLSKQIFPDISDDDQLLRQAAMYGIFPTPATFATGNIVATGVDGSVIPSGTAWNLDADTSYATTSAATIASGTAAIPAQAVLAGTAGNLAATVVLTLESPITGVDGTATVDTDGITGGNDQDVSPYPQTRARLLLRLQEPPEGGADQDYEAWALAVAGVTRVWVYPVEGGLGTVVVRFVMDARPDIFPLVGDVANVQAALEAQRPITAEVTAEAPTALSVAFTIHLSPDTSDLRAAVTAELTDLLTREAIPGDGSGGGTILLTHIFTAIGDAVSPGDYTLTVPSANVVPSAGQLAVLGTVTFV